jgi:hypothetical protein
MLAFYFGLLKVLWTSGGDFPFYDFPFFEVTREISMTNRKCLHSSFFTIHISLKQIFPQQTFDLIIIAGRVGQHPNLVS